MSRVVIGLVGLGSAALGTAAVALVLLAVSAIGVAPGPTGGGVVHGPADVGGLAALEDLAPLRGAPVTGEPTVAEDIVVDVAGAVAVPGLHRLRRGDRVGDAIEAAGGFGPRADLAASAQTLNLAAPLEDGAKVLVPELGPDPVDARPEDGRIDINRSGQAELETLPGVGPVTAQRIIDSRAKERFVAPADLRTRGLVGEAVFDGIRDLVRAGT